MPALAAERGGAAVVAGGSVRPEYRPERYLQAQEKYRHGRDKTEAPLQRTATSDSILDEIETPFSKISGMQFQPNQ